MIRAFLLPRQKLVSFWSSPLAIVSAILIVDLQPRREAVRAGPHERARFGSSKTRLQRDGRAGLGTQRGSQSAKRKARFSAPAVAAPERTAFRLISEI